jgi:hypothetical protein
VPTQADRNAIGPRPISAGIFDFILPWDEGVNAMRINRHEGKRECAVLVVPADEHAHDLPTCLVAERFWDQVRWAIEAYAQRFHGLARASQAGGAA